MTSTMSYVVLTRIRSVDGYSVVGIRESGGEVSGKGKEIRIYSAYRSPSYNNLLVRLGRGAAPNSLHTTGQAVDFAIPGVRLSQVRRAAAKLKRGGVGYYRRRGFIHIDTGPVRYW